MNNRVALSIVIPTLNEVENIPRLFKRIDSSLASLDIPYEIVLIDDNSTDGTIEVAGSLASRYNAHILLKRGESGKAYSLLEGFAHAKHPLVCMIDADLQYPPEEIAIMYNYLIDKDADVVISERQINNTSIIRKFSSRIFNLLFARLLFGINYDTQSGLKLFKKNVLDDFEMTPSPWSFDLEFLVRSLENKKKIISHPIHFADRNAGITKVKLISTTLELAKASVRLRFSSSNRKVKAGNQANIRFLKRSFPAMYLTLLLSSLILFSSPSTGSTASEAQSNFTNQKTSQFWQHS